MQTPAERLDAALASFRREHALAYVAALKEAPVHGAGRTRRLLVSEAGSSLLDEARSAGELDDARYAAVCAHMARAHAEEKYARSRDAQRSFLRQRLPAAGERSTPLELLPRWLGDKSAAERARVEAQLAPALLEHAQALIDARHNADGAAARFLTSTQPPRHADAGPEGGVAGAAEDWLRDSADLTREALQYVRRNAATEGETAQDHLWILLGGGYAGLFPRPGRYRRLASELEPWGMRQQLARAARLAPEHEAPYGSPHVLPVAVPHDIRLAPASLELGLASELAAADALGRAAAHVHASPALPFPLRHASAATTARAVGAISALRFTEPLFLRRKRELSTREAGELARASAAYVLCESRLLAAAVLARGISGADAEQRAQALCERALLGPARPEIALFLLTRLSASSAFRPKLWAAGLAYALRERFDEDWYANPHAGEVLRGACARAGDFSVEALAMELGARIADGPRKLSELF